MLQFVEISTFLTATFLNSVLLVGIMIRPKLWTHLNCLLCSIFVFNLLLVTLDFASKGFPDVLHCAFKHFGFFVQRKISVMFLGGLVFLRFLMVKRGDDIRSGGLPLKHHQASMNMITVFVVIIVGSYAIAAILVMCVNPWFPYDFNYQKICRGEVWKIDKEISKVSLKNMLINCANLSILLIFCFYNQIRVIRFQRSHAPSYFTQRRQNILTFQQTVSANYIYLALHIGDMILMNSFAQPFNPFSSHVSYQYALQVYHQAGNTTVATILPLIWFVSAWRNFPDFWIFNNIWKLRSTEVSCIMEKPKPFRDFLIPRGPYTDLKTRNIDEQQIFESLSSSSSRGPSGLLSTKNTKHEVDSKNHRVFVYFPKLKKHQRRAKEFEKVIAFPETRRKSIQATQELSEFIRVSNCGKESEEPEDERQQFGQNKENKESEEHEDEIRTFGRNNHWNVSILVSRHKSDSGI